MATQSRMRPYFEKWSRSTFVVVFRVSPPMNSFTGRDAEVGVPIADGLRSAVAEAAAEFENVGVDMVRQTLKVRSQGQSSWVPAT
mmetsp:Transcript_2109/g.5297  ORF Transcript_2109/g.5297 Transcript_2109/m.5297 type:complete len:85 (+) Transcript_2109:947-1201(+)